MHIEVCIYTLSEVSKQPLEMKGGLIQIQLSDETGAFISKDLYFSQIYPFKLLVSYFVFCWDKPMPQQALLYIFYIS